MEGWLTSIIRGLVSKPDEVVITSTSDEQGVLFTVKVASDDNGKVIGKQGTIAEALRTITRSAGFLGNMRASMKIDAPGSRFTPRRNQD